MSSYVFIVVIIGECRAGGDRLAKRVRRVPLARNVHYFSLQIVRTAVHVIQVGLIYLPFALLKSSCVNIKIFVELNELK